MRAGRRPDRRQGRRLGWHSVTEWSRIHGVAGLVAIRRLDEQLPHRALAGNGLEQAGGGLAFDVQRHAVGIRKCRVRAVGAGLGKNAFAGSIEQFDRFDSIQGVDHLRLGLKVRRSAGLLAQQGEADPADLAVEHARQLGRKNREADRRVADDRDRNADEPSLLIDHRPAAVAGIERAVDLDVGGFRIVAETWRSNPC